MSFVPAPSGVGYEYVQGASDFLCGGQIFACGVRGNFHLWGPLTVINKRWAIIYNLGLRALGF